MSRKQRVKTLTDVLMTIALLLLMSYELIGQTTHEVIGTAMFLLFILYHALNQSWSKNLLKGRYTPYRAAQTLLAGLILVLMISQAVSGVLVSRHLYIFLPIQGYASIARSLHMLGAYWNLVLMSLHLGLHWAMVLAPFRKVSQSKTVLLRAAGGSGRRPRCFRLLPPGGGALSAGADPVCLLRL